MKFIGLPPTVMVMARSVAGIDVGLRQRRIWRERLADPALQLLESLLVVGEARRLLPGQARAGVLGEVGGQLHLLGEREHVGEESGLAVDGGVDLLGRRMGRGLAERRRQAVEIFVKTGIEAWYMVIDMAWSPPRQARFRRTDRPEQNAMP